MEQDEIGSDGKLQSVLFVCTANIFRSVTAEYALKARLGADTSCAVRSAGIDAKPQPVHAWVHTRLRQKGADLTTHVQRQLTKEMVEAGDVVIAMGRDHQSSSGNNLDMTFHCLLRSASATTSRFLICTK